MQKKENLPSNNKLNHAYAKVISDISPKQQKIINDNIKKWEQARIVRLQEKKKSAIKKLNKEKLKRMIKQDKWERQHLPKSYNGYPDNYFKDN